MANVTVAVCTYRRNDELRRVLPMLLEQAARGSAKGHHVEVLVVDNNPEPAARAVVEELVGAGAPLRYVHQSAPGLAAARNAALAHAAGELIAFIDDDEVPSEDWLTELVAAQAEFAAEVVVGPILVRYQSPPPPWIEAGRFFERDRFPTGTRRPAGHTSNLLLDLEFLRRHGLRFRAEFGASGGEDTMLTREIGSLGGRIVWCDEAPVTDLVPTSRMTPAWVLARRYRMGNSHSRVLLALEPRPVRRGALRARLVLGGTARAAVGYAMRAVGRATGSLERDARGAMLASRGRGIAAGALGRYYDEYQRQAPELTRAAPRV